MLDLKKKQPPPLNHQALIAIKIIAIHILMLAPCFGASASAEQDSAKDEETAKKEAEAAGNESRYSEEIFVEGTAGTVAASSGIATKMDIPLLLTPASVSVVTRALSQEQNAVTVSDALRNQSVGLAISTVVLVGATVFAMRALKSVDDATSG